MNKKNVLGVLLLVAALSVLTTIVSSTPANRNFVAHLSGDNEVPSVDTQAQGQAIFHLSEDSTELHYKLIAANIENITVSHIHLAPAGTNGAIVAFLYPGPTITGRFDGVLAEGNITAANLVGPLAGQPLSALITAMQSGNTYTNVHTTLHPVGEIRGQIR